jgi:hypothetical protein
MGISVFKMLNGGEIALNKAPYKYTREILVYIKIQLKIQSA